MKNNCEEPRKLSVFAGSPKKQLETIRGKIIQAVLESGNIADGMELWASDGRPTLKTISDKLHLCDVHVIVLGQSYGQLLENEEISFTEWEYEQSKEAKRPVIAFLLEKETFEKAWLKSKPSNKEKKAYRNLWKNLCSSSVCKLYKSIDMPSIDRDVLNALNQIVDSGQLNSLAGWVRAESEAARMENIN